MKRNLRWLILGTLLVGAAYLYATADFRDRATMPPDVQGGIGDQLRIKYGKQNVKLALEADELAGLVEKWGERYAEQARVVNRWRVKAQRVPLVIERPGEVVEVPVPGEPIVVEGDCSLSEPTMGVDIRGEQIDVAGRPGMRVDWKASVSMTLSAGGDEGQPVTFDSGWNPGEVLEFDIAPPAPAERPRHLDLRAGLTSAPGVRVGATWFRRGKRLGWWVEGDWAPSPKGDTYYDDFAFEAAKGRAAAGAVLRFGK